MQGLFETMLGVIVLCLTTALIVVALMLRVLFLAAPFIVTFGFARWMHWL